MDSGFNDFFQQLPPIFIVIFCGSGALLLGVIAYLVAFRRQKTRGSANAHPVEAETADEGYIQSNMPAVVASSTTANMSDFPDLDDLLKPPPAHKTRSGTFTISLSENGGDVEVAEVLSVLRDVADGGLVIQIGDKAFRHPPALADAEFKRRFNNTIRDLAASAPGTLPPAEIPKPPPPTPVIAPAPSVQFPVETPANSMPVTETPESIPDAASSVTPEPLSTLTADEPDAESIPELDWSDLPAPELFDLPPVTTETTAKKSTTTGTIPAVTLPGDLPKFRMPDVVEPPKRGRRPTVDRTPVPEINLAAAIEAYLQHKLILSEYSGRSIHVRSAPHGGVVIEVDGKFYDSVGEVTDPAVRAFIATAIEEWQSRQ